MRVRYAPQMIRTTHWMDGYQASERECQYDTSNLSTRAMRSVHTGRRSRATRMLLDKGPVNMASRPEHRSSSGVTLFATTMCTCGFSGIGIGTGAPSRVRFRATWL